MFLVVMWLCLTLASQNAACGKRVLKCVLTHGNLFFPVLPNELDLVLIGASGWETLPLPNLSIVVNRTWRMVEYPIPM